MHGDGGACRCVRTARCGARVRRAARVAGCGMGQRARGKPAGAAHRAQAIAQDIPTVSSNHRRAAADYQRPPTPVRGRRPGGDGGHPPHPGHRRFSYGGCRPAAGSGRCPRGARGHPEPVPFALQQPTCRQSHCAHWGSDLSSLQPVAAAFAIGLDLAKPKHSPHRSADANGLIKPIPSRALADAAADNHTLAPRLKSAEIHPNRHVSVL